MLDALAFLPLTDVANGMAFLRGCVPLGDGLDSIIDLVDYFDATYVSGSLRTIKDPLTVISSSRSGFGRHRHCSHQLCGTFMRRRCPGALEQTIFANPRTTDLPV